MKVEADQSIKIEQTHADTIIGVSNSKECAIVIPRQIKRKLKRDFRDAGIPRLFAYRTFIAGLVLALEYAKFKHLSDIVIDIEYVGQERRLRSIFLEMWSWRHEKIPDVSFHLIGKKSRAHKVGYRTMNKKRKPDTVLTHGQLKKLIFPRQTKKPERLG